MEKLGEKRKAAKKEEDQNAASFVRHCFLTHGEDLTNDTWSLFLTVRRMNMNDGTEVWEEGKEYAKLPDELMNTPEFAAYATSFDTKQVLLMPVVPEFKGALAAKRFPCWHLNVETKVWTLLPGFHDKVWFTYDPKKNETQIRCSPTKEERIENDIWEADTDLSTFEMTKHDMRAVGILAPDLKSWKVCLEEDGILLFGESGRYSSMGPFSRLGQSSQCVYPTFSNQAIAVCIPMRFMVAP